MDQRKQTKRPQNQAEEIDLLHLAKVLWDHVINILTVTILCGIIGFVITAFFIKPSYEAQTLLYVNNNAISLGSASFSISSSDISASRNLVDTYTVILKTRSTLNAVIRKAGLDYTYEELSKMIASDAVNNTEIFYVKVTTHDPEEAEKIANTIGEILPDKISDVVDGSSVRIVDYAVVPAHKSAPSITKNTAIAMMLGFVLCCGVYIVMDLLDTIIHDEDYLLNTYSVPVLASIPDLTSDSSASKYGYGYGSQHKA